MSFGQERPAENAYLSVTLGEQAIEADTVSVVVEDHDRLIDKAIIKVDDPMRPYTDFTQEDQMVKVELGWPSAHALVFEGVVTSVDSTTENHVRRVTITAFDLSLKLMRGPARTANHSGTLSQIIRTLVEAAAIPVGAIEISPDPEYTTDSPARQTNLTDWEFIQASARRHHARAFVEINEGTSKFYFVSEVRFIQLESMGTLEYCTGSHNLIWFEYRRRARKASAPSSASVTNPVSGETQSTPEVTPAAAAPPPAPDPVTAADLSRVDPSAARRYENAGQRLAEHAGNPESHRPSRRTVGTASDLQLITRAGQFDPTREHGLFGRGRAVGNVNLRAKGIVTIKGIGATADGSWYTSCVRHEVKDRHYETRFWTTR